MQRRWINWGPLSVSRLPGRKPQRRRRRRIYENSWRPETLEVRSLLSGTTIDDSVAEAIALTEEQQAIADRIHALTYQEFPGLKRYEARYLTPSQVNSIPNAKWFNRIPNNVKRVLGTDQLAELRVRRTGLRGLAAHQINKLDTTQIRILRARDLRYVTPPQAHNITLKQVGEIRNPTQLKRIKRPTLHSFDGDQIRALRVARTGIQQLSDAQVQELSISQIQSLRRGRDVERLSPEQLAFRDPASATAPLNDLARLTESMNVAESAMVELGAIQVGDLTVAEIRAFTYRNFHELTAEQSPWLMIDQIGTIPNDWWFRKMPEETRAAFTQEQVQAVPVENVGLAGFSDVQVGVLSAGQIQVLGYRSFERLSSEQMPLLTVDQLATIPNSWWFGRIPEKSRHALTAEQIRALYVADLGLSGLNPIQISALTIEQIISLNYREFEHLNTEQSPHLTGDQLSSIPNSWWFGRMSVEARAALLPTQVQALRVAELGLGNLTTEQIRALTREQIQSLSYRDFQYLNPEQTPHLTAEQVATIPNGWWFGRMSEAARAAFGGDQVRALDVADVGVSGLTADQVGELSVEQIQILGYRQFQYLNEEQTPHLTGDQLATIPNGWWFTRISQEARAALTGAQVRALDVAALGLGGITESQIAQLSTDQIQSLEYRQFEFLNAGQIVLLTAEQLGTLPNQWWFARIPEAVRAAITGDQIRALPVDKTGLSELTTEQVAELSDEQILTLGYRSFENLTGEQTPLLTEEQLDTIPNEWWFRRVSDEGRAALIETQVQSLDVGNLKLTGLADEQVTWLTVDQIQSLQYRDFDRLSADQIVHLTADQIASIPNGWYFNRIPELVRQALTDNQVHSLNVEEISIRYLSGTQQSMLMVEQIQSLTYHDFRYLDAEQVVHLTRDQMSSIQNKWHFLKMSDEARAALSQDQLLALPNAIHAALNHQPAHLFAPTEDHGPTIATEEEHEQHPDEAGHADGAAAGDPGTDHEHDDTGPHPDTPEKQLEHLALFDLVPHDEATFVSVANGEWSDPAVWEGNVVPGEDAQVLIASGTTVTFDIIQYDAMNWVRVDGTLDWDIDDDTQMYVDTLIVDGAGVLSIGSSDQPVEHGVAARIVIADSGEDIDVEWDPIQISRGVIAHGTAQFFGEEVTPYVSLATDPRRGDTELVLDEVPTNWEVGHRIVLTGTDSNHRHPQDEELEIIDIDGTTVRFDADSDEPGIQALSFNHLTPEGHDLSVYVANMNRNVVIMSENPSITQRRGHVMFMHNQRVEVENVGFYGLGRTDKRNPANDAVFDDEGTLVLGLNQRGRYAVHFHRAGSSYDDNPGLVSGSVVVDSPGLGYVNHDSYAHFRDNVAFNVVGSSFFTEFGNEIGSFERNLSIRNTGSGDGLESREGIFDFGHGGHGFWFQGPGVEAVDNISTGARDSAFNFFTSSSMAKFDVANMADPSLAAGRDAIPVGMVPLRKVEGNIAFGSRSGLETWFHQTNSSVGQSYIDDFTAWNVGRGVFNPYTGRTTIRNATVIGNPDRPNGTAFGRNNVTNQMTYEDVNAIGWQVGIDVPVNRTTVIRDGHFEAVQAVRISTAHDTLREVEVFGDPEFVTLTESQLRGRTQYDIFMNGDISMRNRDIETYFTPDIVRLGTVRFNDHQVYYHKQAADFVPFPVDDSPEWMPAELLGKTNTQLWEEFGIAPGGTIAPDDAVEVERINGLVGSRSEYQSRLKLRSSKYTNELDDYVLSFVDANGDLVVDAAAVDLREGWNLITRQVAGETRTFFVYGDVTEPTFQLTMSDDELRVNPLGLSHGFVVHGRVFDDSFGDMTFRKKFKDLQERPILTDEDGTEYIELSFTIRDLAGNSLDVTVRVVLDPDAPLVPGTGQRDLPPRPVPQTLAELIEYYFLTGETDGELILDS